MLIIFLNKNLYRNYIFFVDIYIYIYIYKTHTHTHTYIHTYTQKKGNFFWFFIGLYKHCMNEK